MDHYGFYTQRRGAFVTAILFHHAHADCIRSSFRLKLSALLVRALFENRGRILDYWRLSGRRRGEHRLATFSWWVLPTNWTLEHIVRFAARANPHCMYSYISVIIAAVVSGLTFTAGVAFRISGTGGGLSLFLKRRLQ